MQPHRTDGNTATPNGPTTAIGRFFVRTPAGWTPIRGSDDQPRAGFSPANAATGSRQVTVQIWLAPNSEAALRDLAFTEMVYRVDRTGYRRIGLDLARFAGNAESAKWEWTWTDHGVVRHVMQYAVQDQDGRLYILSFAAADADFPKYRPIFDAVADSAGLDRSAEPKTLVPVVAEGIAASVPTNWKTRPNATGNATDFYRPADPTEQAPYLTFGRQTQDGFFVNGYDWATFAASNHDKAGYQLISRKPVSFAGIKNSGRWDFYRTTSKGIRQQVRWYGAIKAKAGYVLQCAAPDGEFGVIDKLCDQVAATAIIVK